MHPLSVLTKPVGQQSAGAGRSQPSSQAPGDATAERALDAAADGARQAIVLRAVHIDRRTLLALFCAPPLCQQLLQTRDGKLVFVTGWGVQGTGSSTVPKQGSCWNLTGWPSMHR